MTPDEREAVLKAAWDDECSDQRSLGGLLEAAVRQMRAAVADEREACAAQGERVVVAFGMDQNFEAMVGAATVVAGIRARGKADAQVQQHGPGDLRIKTPPVTGPVCPVCGAGLRWTSDPPKERGHYWYREHEGYPKERCYQILNVRIYDGKPHVIHQDDWTELTAAGIEGGEWSGPLEHPPG